MKSISPNFIAYCCRDLGQLQLSAYTALRPLDTSRFPWVNCRTNAPPLRGKCPALVAGWVLARSDRCLYLGKQFSPLFGDLLLQFGKHSVLRCSTAI